MADKKPVDIAPELIELPPAEEPKMDVPPVTQMVPPAVPAIDAVMLENILRRLEAQDDEIATLRASVSQNKLEAVEKSKKPAGLPVAYLKVLDGKVVTSWKSEKPQYIYNPANPEVPIGEILKARYFFLDGGDTGPIDQTEFVRSVDKIEASILEGDRGLKDPEVKELTLRFTKLITTDEDLAARFVLPADLKINKNFLNP